MRRCVVVCSAKVGSETERLYRQAALGHARSLGEAVLDSEASDMGWILRADGLVVYYDLGVDIGTVTLVRTVSARGRGVELRSLPTWRKEAPSDRQAALERLSAAVTDAAASLVAEQVTLLVDARSVLCEVASAILGPLEETQRTRLSAACSELADKIAPELTEEEIAGVREGVLRRIA